MKKILLVLLFVKMVFAFDAPPFPSYDMIIPSTSSQNSMIEGNMLELKKGWAMYGFDKGIHDLNKTFMLHSDDIDIIWSYLDDKKSWGAFSSNSELIETIQNNPNITLINNINSNKGFWVLSNSDINITLDPNLGIPDEIVLISTEQEIPFETTGGEFTINISPLDDNQDLISENLTKDNFIFKDAKLLNSSGVDVADINIVPTSLSVTTPTTTSSANNIVVDIDSSGSMSSNDPNKLRANAAKQLVNILSSNDIMAIMDFGAGSDNGYVNSRLLQNFTNDKAALSSSIDKIEESGSTPMYQSILDASTLLNKTQYGTKTLILFTDGEANDDGLKSSALETAKNSLVTIHTIGLGSGVDDIALKNISSQTGGVYGHASDATELNNIFLSIGTGAIKGKVTITGNGSFTKNVSVGSYILKGTLTTIVYNHSIDTIFELPIEIK